MVFRKIQFIHNPDGLSLRLESLEGNGEMISLHFFNTGQSPEKIQMPEGAAEFAIGDIVISSRLYFFYKVRNSLVLCLFQGAGVDFSSLKGCVQIVGLNGHLCHIRRTV